MNNPPIIDIYWEGPYTLDNIDNIQKSQHCLYQVYGTHPVYGTNSLLYIGKTEQKSATKRIKQHLWIENQCDICRIYVATCGEFTNWENWDKDTRERYEQYSPVHDIKIVDIESLLIYAHQPSYNSSSLKSTSFAENSFRLFNSGRRAKLLPEISTQYYSDPNENHPLITTNDM